MSFVEEALALQGNLSALRREFHAHPELSRKEFWTAERIEKELDDIGITDRKRVDGTAVIATLRGEKPGDRVVALRADIDALPILEKPLSERPYCSQQEGVMHACGHDGHTTGLLGAARLLYAHRHEFGGEVRFLFQHGEEIGYGARVLVKEGVMEGVGRVFGVHMAPDLPFGVIGCTPGPNNASVDRFVIRVQGAAAHVSTPQKGVDALSIAAHIVVGIQSVVTRRTDPVDPLIVGVCRMESGTAYNIVAGSAELEGTVRATTLEKRREAQKLINELCERTAESFGGTATVAWEDYCTPLTNPQLGAKEAGEVVADLFGSQALKTDRPFSLGGDDFAEFVLLTEGCYAYVGTRNPEDGNTHWPLHSDHFDLDERVLPEIAALEAEYATQYLNGVFG